MEHREGGEFADPPSDLGCEPLFLVSCICCRKLHRAANPRDFRPVCSSCAAAEAL
jgi:hypothetical protein